MSHSPPPGAPKARIPGPQQPPPPYPRIAAGLWRRCLGVGFALWVPATWVTYETRGSALLPTVILLGSFLVPVAFVLWAYERHGRDLGVSAILGCFLAGGTLGVLGASLTGWYPARTSPGTLLGVGLAEEAAKLAALVFVLRRQPAVRGPRAGLVLGAAVGFGFAALESAGYAFQAAASAQGVSLLPLLETEILRGVLAPVGHGLWTAIAGGALLSRRRLSGRFRIAAPVLGTCLGVSLLHALWDSTHALAIWSVTRLTGGGPEGQLFTQGYLVRPSTEQEHLFTLFSVGGPALVALAGIGWVRSLARRAPTW
ncbi:PrsW family glutamic-type intramembrane protease [Streptomyces sp. NPDC048191]|uniref:PrsW family glutamic-type intramembrane protease n=1 Tax=Streptomyces sp. NPDC048191 TaxID=3155484 RepID=UPI0033D17B35